MQEYIQFWKRAFNYIDFFRCVDSLVKVLEDTGHTIIFVVDDVAIDRVEFIIRRCNGVSLDFQICLLFIFKIDLSKL
jgi:hypothetical protein